MDSKTYMWSGLPSDVPRVGKKVCTHDGVEVCCGDKLQWILMQPLYQTTCEWVRESDLREYVGGREVAPNEIRVGELMAKCGEIL